MDRLKTTAGVVAAIAGAVTGLWTIYEKVKADARQYTATSYETLAPQINQMSEALRKVQEENQELKQALVSRGARPRPAKTNASAPAKRPEPGTSPAPATAGATAPVATGSAPTPAQEQQKEQDTLDRIIGTMQQTREAVDAVRKVPESFEKVLEQQKKK